MATPTDSQPIGALQLLASFTVFGVFFVELPLLRFMGVIPLELQPTGRWIYATCALVFCVLIALVGQPHSRRRRVMLIVGLSLSLTVVLPTATFTALGHVLSGFGTISPVTQASSPDGRFVLVHEYNDQGATGANDVVYVRGRLIPGVVDWHYIPPCPVDMAIQHVGWDSDGSILVNARSYPLPAVIRWLAW